MGKVSDKTATLAGEESEDAREKLYVVCLRGQLQITKLPGWDQAEV